MEQINAFNLYFDIFWLILIVLLFFWCIRDKKLRNFFHANIKKRTLLCFALIFLFGVFLRVLTAPSDYVGYIWEYNAVGKSIFLGENNTFGGVHPIGYPLILSIFFFFFGANIASVHLTGILFGSLTILAIFLLAYALLKCEYAALFSALLLALNPWHIYLSGTSDVEIIAAFFMVAGIAVLKMSFDIKAKKVFILGYLLLLFSVQIKRELMVVLGLTLVYYVFQYRKEIWGLLEKYSYHSLFLFWLSSPVLIDFGKSIAINNEYRYITLSAASNNLFEIASYLAEYVSIPLLSLTVFSAVALWRFSNNKTNIAFLCLLFFSLFTIYLFFRNYLEMRYVSFLGLPLMIILSAGISRFLRKYPYKLTATAIVISFIFAPLVFSYAGCSNGFDSCPYFKSYSRYQGDLVANAVHHNLLNAPNKNKILLVAENEVKMLFWFLYPEDKVFTLSDFLLHNTTKEEVNGFFSNNSVFLLDFRCECLEKAPKDLTRGLLCEDVIQFSDNIAYSYKGYAVYHLAPCSNCSL